MPCPVLFEIEYLDVGESFSKSPCNCFKFVERIVDLCNDDQKSFVNRFLEGHTFDRLALP